LHLVKRERMAVVNVSEKLFVGLLVVKGFREVEPHESDGGVDVWYGHVLHVAELRSRVSHRDVDGSNVVGSGSRGVILETEAHPEATGKVLVRDGGTCDGVQEKDFRPGSSTTVGRVDLDFCKHFVERSETLGLVLEELPKPVLEYGVRGFAVAGKPRCAHRTMQFLFFIGQIIPFNNRQHDDPHVSRPELLEDPITKEHAKVSREG
jgi:hypothetical protein